MTTRIEKRRAREAARQAIIGNLVLRLRTAGGADAVPWRELRKQAREELAAARAASAAADNASAAALPEAGPVSAVTAGCRTPGMPSLLPPLRAERDS